MTTRGTVAQAVMDLREAHLKRAQAHQLARLDDPLAALFERKDAARLEASADAVLNTQAGDVPVVRGLGEVVAQDIPDASDVRTACFLADSLAHPGVIEAQAALERQKLLLELGSLEMALDLQKTISPENSLERMLAGQMASAHLMALTTLLQAQAWLQRADEAVNPHWQQHSQEGVRLINASARLMSSFQDAAVTLQRLRQGSRHEMHVYQHVEVGSGAQAVIAGQVHQGGSPPGNEDGVGNEGTMPCEERLPQPGVPHAAAPTRGKGRRVSKPPCGANGVAACMGDTSPEPPEATSWH